MLSQAIVGLILLLDQLVFLGGMGFADGRALSGIFQADSAGRTVAASPGSDSGGNGAIIFPASLDKFYLLPLETISLPLMKENAKIPDISAKAALAVDSATGKVLYEKNSNAHLPIASLTKLTTALVVIGEIKDFDEAVIVSREDLSAPGGGVGLAAGEKISVENLLYMMLVSSSNDAALALAEFTGGRVLAEGGAGGQKTEDANFQAKVKKFVELLNAKAASLDLADTHFTNPDGLDQEGNFSSAADVVKVVRYLFNDNIAYDADDIYGKKLIRAIIKTNRITVYSEDKKSVHYLKSTNKLLGGLPNVIGGKTGFTDEAGESLVLVVADQSNRHSIITVVLNASDRFLETKKLADWVFSVYTWERQ